MGWPTVANYNDAIQSPRISFADPDLQAGEPELNALGLPRPVTGSFASVYSLRCGGDRWAVRCFTREFPDYQRRYNAIGVHLKKRKLPHTVGFEFQEKGILVGGAWYPILKMEWVNGCQLNEHVRSLLGDAARLNALAENWLALIASLRQAGIAHGDLQHGNVMVVGTDLKLVDYDGMFVPALKGSGSHETGHPAYQHPTRTGDDFNNAVDRFSNLAIYLALRALQLRPQLWDQFDNQDNLLFKRSDYRDPDASPLFQELLKDGDGQIRRLAKALRDACQAPMGRVPRVEELVVRVGSLSARRPAWMDDYLPPVPVSSAAPKRRTAPRRAKNADPLMGREIIHTIFGHGVILSSGMSGENPVITVQFDNGAERKLLAGHHSIAYLPLSKRKTSSTDPSAPPRRARPTKSAKANGAASAAQEGDPKAARRGITLRFRSAVRAGRMDVVEASLRYDPSLVHHRDHTGRMPLHDAVEFLHPGVVEILLRYDSDVTVPDDRGDTPLMVAKRLGNQGAGDAIRRMLERAGKSQSGKPQGRWWDSFWKKGS